jgi:DinB superfamily
METALTREISASERQIAIEDFNATRDALHAELLGLTEEQWIFKPAPHRWSIAQNVQHVTAVEARVHAILANLKNCAESSADRDDHSIDRSLRNAVLDRTLRVEAPVHLRPSGDWTIEEAWRRFEENRQQSIRLLDEADCLRGYTLPHPIFGPWDRYQWLLAAAGHCGRHTLQIIEVKQDSAFPAS